MSEPTSEDAATLPAAPAVDAPGPAEPVPGDDATTDHEAARYRTQLRAAEKARDAVTSRLETLQRREVERIVASLDVQRPAAIWAGGTQLADLLDDDGNVDQVLVEAATEKAIEALGLSIRPAPLKPDHSQGARGAADNSNGWAQLLTKGKR